MRVVSLMLMLLAGPVFASEDQQTAGPARFAYAQAFQKCFEGQSTDEVREAILADAGEGPKLRPLMFVAAERLIAPGADRTSTQTAALRSAVTAGKFETVVLVQNVEPVHSPRPTPQRLAAMPEPMHLHARVPAAEIVAVEPQATDRKLPALNPHHKSAARAHLGRRRRWTYAPLLAIPNKVAETKARFPQWAAKMFKSVWQQRAFAYQ